MNDTHGEPHNALNSGPIKVDTQSTRGKALGTLTFIDQNGNQPLLHDGLSQLMPSTSKMSSDLVVMLRSAIMRSLMDGTSITIHVPSTQELDRFDKNLIDRHHASIVCSVAFAGVVTGRPMYGGLFIAADYNPVEYGYKGKELRWQTSFNF